MLFLRSWQAVSLIKFYYYFTMVLAIVYGIATIVDFTIMSGVGGFFVGLLYAILAIGFTVIFSRITSELFLSIFAIRDSLATGHSPSVVTSRVPAQDNTITTNPQYQDL